MFFDPMYLLYLAPGLLLTLWAQFKVKRAMSRYSKVPSSSGMTGSQVARAILDRYAGRDVQIEITGGVMSDHYDPSKRILRLSEDVYHGRSVAAVGIAAHEAGHAIQHKMAYGPLVLRQTLAPAAIWGSNLSWILIVVGTMVSMTVAWIGVALFALAVAFTLVTLPVEFNASRRAKEVLSQMGLVSSSDRDGAAAVLNAAAMTYVAAAATAILQLFYFLTRLSGSRD